MNVGALHIRARDAEEHAVRKDVRVLDYCKGTEKKGVIAPEPHAVVNAGSDFPFVRVPRPEPGVVDGRDDAIDFRTEVVNYPDAVAHYGCAGCAPPPKMESHNVLKFDP